MKARRWLAALLAGTMVLGSVVNVSAAETLSGTEWWSDYEVSDDSTLSGDGTWTYLIDMVSVDDGCGYVIEVSDTDYNYYITTTGHGDAWTANNLEDDAALGDISVEREEDYQSYDSMQCAVEITRSDTQFVFNYYEITDSAAILFQTYTVTDAEAFGTDVYARFMAHVGSFDLTFYEGSYVSDNGLSLVNLITDEWSELEGTDGDLIWKLDTEGTLTISGEGDYDSDASCRAWYPFRSIATEAVVNVTGITSTANMLFGMYNLTEVDVSNLDTSEVINMNGMFSCCGSLTSVNVSDWDTSNVEDMGYLFDNCPYLVSVDVSNWDTSNVTNMGAVFRYCTSLETADVSKWDTSNAISMGEMFIGCSSLTSVDVSGWDTSSVENMGNMFNGCSSLTAVDVSSWDTSNATIDYMFAYCTSLVELDLRNFDTSNAEYWDSSFNFVEGCSSLTLLKAPASFGYHYYDEDSDTSTWTAISLPSVDGYYWANANAETVTEIDPNLDSEMWYIRYADGETAKINYMGVAQDISNATVTLGTTSYTYDGSAKKPSVTVVYNGETLVSGTDYTVSYSSNTNAGTAKVTITGIGDFEGSTTSATFTISKASQTVTASAASSSMTYGKTTTITASTTGDGALSYSSSDTSVATVSSSGVVTAKGAGTTTITVTAAATTNYSKATKTVKITVTRASQTLSVSSSSVTLAVGGTSTPTVSGAKTTVSYSSSDTSIATVNSSGKITAKKVGTVTITVTAAQTSQYSKATKTITVKVKPTATTVSSVTNTTSGVKVTWKKVTGATGYYVYRATSKNGTYTKIATITSGSTVTYTNKTSGTYKVSSGKTYYYKVSAYASTGTASKSSAVGTKYLTAGKISSLTNTSSGITVKWSKVSGASGYYVYRKASTASSYTLVKKVTGNSTVSYTDTGVKSKNGTTYTYKVVPYSGSYQGSFTTEKTVRMTAVSLSSVKNSSSKKMTVKWSKNSKATGYQIQYSTSKSFASGNKTVTVSGASSSSRVIGSLTKGKTYYVRIRTYKTVSGTKYYSAWSSKKSVKISK